MVRVERLLHHIGDANNVLPTAIAYRSVPRYGYCVSCTYCIARCVSRYTVALPPARVYRSGPDHAGGYYSIDIAMRTY